MILRPSLLDYCYISIRKRKEKKEREEERERQRGVRRSVHGIIARNPRNGMLLEMGSYYKVCINPLHRTLISA